MVVSSDLRPDLGEIPCSLRSRKKEKTIIRQLEISNQNRTGNTVNQVPEVILSKINRLFDRQDSNYLN